MSDLARQLHAVRVTEHAGAYKIRTEAGEVVWLTTREARALVRAYSGQVPSDEMRALADGECSLCGVELDDEGQCDPECEECP